MGSLFCTDNTIWQFFTCTENKGFFFITVLLHGACCLLHYNAGRNKDYHPYIDSTTLVCICGCRSVTLKLTCAYIHTCSFLCRVYVSNYFVPLPLSSATLAASVKDRSTVAMYFSQCLSNLRVDPHCLFTFDTSRASVRACVAGELEGALMQWPDHLNLLFCNIWSTDGWMGDIVIYTYVCMRI